MDIAKMTHHEKISQIRFFTKHHETLTDIFHRIRTSIFTDVKEDEEIMASMNRIIVFIERKMTEQKQDKKINLDSILIEFDGACPNPNCQNEIDSIKVSIDSIIHYGTPICPECECELDTEDEGKII